MLTKMIPIVGDLEEAEELHKLFLTQVLEKNKWLMNSIENVKICV